MSSGKLIPTFRRFLDSLCLEVQAGCSFVFDPAMETLHSFDNYLPVEKSRHLRKCQCSSKRLWELQTSLKLIYFIIDNYKS